MSNTSGTVKKALDILDVFLKHGAELSLNEITEMAGYNRATVFRLLSTLAQHGYLSQVEKKGKYVLGLRTIELGYTVRTNLTYLETMYVHLAKLCREHLVPVNVTLLEADKLIVIDEIGIANEYRITALVGKTLPMHATAAGKVMLAFMSADERKGFIERHPLEPLTKNTITDFHVLEKELEIIKKDGIAFDHEEHILGTWATAYPVYFNKNILAVNSVVAPSSKIDPYKSQILSAALKNCSVEITYVLNRTLKRTGL